MSTTRTTSDPAARGNKADRYWLVWVAAGFGAGSMISHVLV